MPRKNEPTERQCAVTRQVLPAEALIRFVLDPEGRVVPDLKRRLPGRGVWVTASRAVISEAEKGRSKVFGRGFKADAGVEPGLADRVEALLETASLQALSMTRKAGELVTGHAKVEAAIKGGTVAGLVHASDAADDGVRKLAAVVARENGPGQGYEIVRTFDSSQLGLALGGTNVIHAALLAGQASSHFLSRVRKLEDFRGGAAAQE